MKRNVLVLSSVASMIDQFNIPNIKLLIDMGYKVHVACNFEKGNTISEERIIDLKKRLDTYNVSYHQIDFERSLLNFTMNLKAYQQVNKLMNSNDFQFVHCHSPIGGVVARLSGKKNKVKVIYTAHGFHFFKGAPFFNWLIYYPIEKWLSRYTDTLITINEEDYQMAKEKKLKPRKIEFVHGVGINLDKFKKQTKEDKDSLREQYGYRQDDFILFYAAELNRNKNQILLIESIAKLVSEIPNIKLLLAGTGALENEYKEKVEQLNITNNVEFLGYRVDISNLLLLSDLSVASSKREGLPVNLLEAMATGLPIIAVNSRGHRELIEREINGFLIEENVESFFDSVMILYRNRAKIESYGNESTKIVEKYSIDSVMEKVKSIYEDN